MRATALIRIGIATGMTTVLSVVAPAPSPSYAAVPVLTLSTPTGPSGGGNAVTAATLSAGTLLFPVGSEPTVQFQYGATGCRSTAQNVAEIAGTASTLTAGVLTVNPVDVRRISNTRIAFSVPSSSYPADGDGNPSGVNAGGLVLLDGQPTSKWNVCLYDSDSTTASTLIASATYTLAQRPTITSIFPASSPAFGGQSITVNGAGFSAGTTASIDGAALTNVQLAPNGTSFTALTPSHAAGAGLALTVRSLGGQVSSTDPDNDDDTADTPILFTFDGSISIEPETAVAGSVVNIDIHGVDLDALNFDPIAAPTDPTAHVFLVRDAYDPGANRGVLECTEVLVVSSSELICTLDLSADRLNVTTSAPVDGMPVTDGTYTMTLVANGSPDVTGDVAAASVISSGATFTVASH